MCSKVWRYWLIYLSISSLHPVIMQRLVGYCTYYSHISNKFCNLQITIFFLIFPARLNCFSFTQVPRMLSWSSLKSWILGYGSVFSLHGSLTLKVISACYLDVMIVENWMSYLFYAVDCCTFSWCPPMQWPWELC